MELCEKTLGEVKHEISKGDILLSSGKLTELGWFILIGR
jgi:hypothetical protein